MYRLSVHVPLAHSAVEKAENLRPKQGGGEELRIGRPLVQLFHQAKGHVRGANTPRHGLWRSLASGTGKRRSSQVKARFFFRTVAALTSCTKSRRSRHRPAFEALKGRGLGLEARGSSSSPSGATGAILFKDVQYTYLYRSQGKLDLSVERYRFDGELSYARYIVHEVFVAPDAEGDVIQAYDGETTRVSVAGRVIRDPKQLQLARFLRSTNFYWFAMMHKLRDPGVRHRYKGTKKMGDAVYDLLEVTFEGSDEDTADTYLLYINPETHLVDQFLFTVVALGKTKPFLMKVQYDDFGSIKLPTRRKYAPSDWDGRVNSKEWVHEVMTGLHFDNGFKRKDFEL